MVEKKIEFLPLYKFLSLRTSKIIDFMKKGLFPSIFEKNFNAMTPEDQIKLMESRVLIIGCGGLGGFTIEILARTGIGNIFISDGDVFEESNMNRQLYCNIYSLNKKKVCEAEKKIRKVAPLSKIYSIPWYLNQKTLPEVMNKVDIVIDCSGGIEFKRGLLKICQNLKKPLITGAVAGFEGFVSSITPTSIPPLEFFEGINQQGAEIALGSVAPSVALASSIQTSETISYLCENKMKLESKILYFSLKDMYFEILKL